MDEYTDLKDDLNPDGNTEEVDENLEETTSDTITEEYAKQNGLPKGFIGKPWNELGSAYLNVLKLADKASQTNKSLEKRLSDMEKKLTAKEAATVENKVEQAVDDQIGEAPEPMEFDTTAEYKKALSKWMDKRDEIREKKLMEALDKKLGSKYDPKLKTLEDQRSEELKTKYENAFMKDFQDGISSIHNGVIPEGIDFEQIKVAWLEEAQKEYSEDELKVLYGGKPSRMAKDIVKFYKENLKDEDLTEAQKKREADKLKQKEIDKLKEKQKNSRTTGGAPLQRAKSDPKERDDYSDLKDDLRGEAQGRGYLKSEDD